MTSSQTSEVPALKAEIQVLENRVCELSSQLEWLKKQVFGKKSEKVIEPDADAWFLPGFGESQSGVGPEVSDHVPVNPKVNKRRRKKGDSSLEFSEDLPVEELVLDIPEEDKLCKETGSPLKRIGERVSTKLAFRPGSYFIKKTIRPEYANPEAPEAGVLAADLPGSFLPGCRADESFVADILTKKFADHLPLYRICEILGRDSIKITRQLLSQWVIKSGEALSPLHEKLREQILLGANLYMDESPVAMQVKGKGKTQQAYMWVMVGGEPSNPQERPPCAYFDFRTDRKHGHASELMGEFSGRFHSDKFGAYESIANSREVTWCPCWVHIRRQFFEAESGDPVFRAWILRKMKYLFMLDRVARARSEQELLKIRQEKAAPIIDEIIQETKRKLDTTRCPPKSKFRKALGYLVSLTPHLKNYTLHPYSRLDNNYAEQVIRPLAIGRKNWLFVGSERGGKAAAVLMSLVQTCRMLNINPREYLEDVLRRIMSHNIQSLDELLPAAWAKINKKKDP